MDQPTVLDPVLLDGIDFLRQKFDLHESSGETPVLVFSSTETPVELPPEGIFGPETLRYVLEVDGRIGDFMPPGCSVVTIDTLVRSLTYIPVNVDEVLDLVAPTEASMEFILRLDVGGSDYQEYVPVRFFKTGTGKALMQSFAWDPNNGLHSCSSLFSTAVTDSVLVPIARVFPSNLTTEGVTRTVQAWWPRLLHSLRTAPALNIGVDPWKPEPLLGLVSFVGPILDLVQDTISGEKIHTFLCARVSFLGRVFRPDPAIDEERRKILRTYGAR